MRRAQPVETFDKLDGPTLLRNIERDLTHLATYPSLFWLEFRPKYCDSVRYDTWKFVCRMMIEATNDLRQDDGMCPMLSGSHPMSLVAAAIVLKEIVKEERFASATKFEPGEHYHVRIGYNHEKFDTLEEAKRYIGEKGYVFDGVRITSLPGGWS